MRIFQEAKYSQLVDEENPILNNTDNLENNEPKTKKSCFNSELLSKMIFYTLIFGVLAVLIHSIVKLCFGHFPELEVVSKSLLRFTMNNSTHVFAPTVILISLDGFRPDYLSTNSTPNMEKFATKTPYMIPSFPSITFPNHYTLVTGLYPESHGIVGNSFFDPTLKKTFYYTHPQDSHDSFWWGGEPIWVTAEKNNVKTAVHMWPGCETTIKNYKPTYMEPYSKKFTLTQKMDQVLGWLDLPSQDRPGFIGVYVSDVDTAGHNYGPGSDVVKEKVQNVDQMIGHLTEGLKSRNLNDIVNVILVSDHGMAQVDNKNVIYLDDYIDTDLIADTHLYPLAGIIPKDLSKVQDIYNQLKRKVNTTSKWNVYLREEIPDHFHFKNNMRIPPIVGIQESGWAFSTHKEYPDPTQPFHPAGLHGYDNTHPDMRALFIANGPYFNQMTGQDVKPLSPFQNLEVYGLLTDILGVEFAPNNGTQLLSHYFKSPVSAKLN